MTSDHSRSLNRSLANASELLRRGQSHESDHELPAALAHYDEAIAALRTQPPADCDEPRRLLAVALMNRGNALQKLATPSPAPSEKCHLMGDTSPCTLLDTAIGSYDEAIALLRTLPFGTTPADANHLGAAWLNRGHALLAANDSVSAADSFEQAIEILRYLPLDENPAYRLNLAGAWTNLAHALLSAPLHAFPRSYAAAQTALDLVADLARTHAAFAEMSLRARRALVTAVGELLVIAETSGQPTDALATAASDVIDDGLALAREWETRGAIQLRPLALRLFRLGAQLYRVHQPHFLAEFLLENLDSTPSRGTLATHPELHAIATQALAFACADLQRPRLFVADTPDAEKLLATFRSLRAAQLHLSALSQSSGPL